MDRRRFLCATTALILSPEALARSAGGTTPVALVTADLESRIVAVELETGRRLASIRTLPDPRSIQAVGNVAVVAHSAQGALSLIHPDLTVRRVIRGLDEPRYAAASSNGRYAFVTDSGLSGLAVVDVLRGRIVARLALGGPARHLSVDSSGRWLWAALGSKANRIAIIDVRDPRRPRLLGRIRPSFLAHDVGFAPGGRRVWVTSGDTRTIAIFDARTGRAVTRLRAHAPPQHVTFSGRHAFITSGDDGTLRVHAVSTGRLVGERTIPKGSFNVQEARGRILTPSLSTGTLCIHDANGRPLHRLDVARSSHDACSIEAG